MKDVPPEATAHIAMSLPLLALGLALFLTAFLLVAGALISLLPEVYEKRENRPSNKGRVFGLMIVIAVVCAGVGYLTLSGLTVQLEEATVIMSNVDEAKN